MRRWLSDTTGGLPRTFWILWTGSLINRAGGFVVISLTIYLTTVQHFSPARAGLVMGLWAAGGAIGTMLGGIAADRIGRKPTLVAAHAGTAAVLAVLAFASGFAAIAPLVLLFGLVSEAARPAFQAMMVDVVPERDRVRAFSLTYWAVNLGFTCAAMLGGFAAQADPHLIFLIDGATALVPLSLILFLVTETHRPAAVTVTSGAAAGAAPGALRVILRDRVFLGFVGTNLLIAFVFMQHLSTLPVAMTGDGLSARTYGFVIGLNGVLIVVGQLFIPKLMARHERPKVLAAAALIVGLGFGLTAFADTVALYAVTVLIWTVGEMLNSPAGSALGAGLSPAAMRGRYQGFMSLSWSVAGFAAPTAGGYVQQHFGNSALWLGCGVLGLLAAAVQLWTGPARERRVAQLSSPAAEPRLQGATA